MVRRAFALAVLGGAHAVLGGVLPALGVVAILSGCAIRYDSAGTTRVGIGLWGFGDPPGVDWNLDGPRREVPDLPAMRPPELPDVPRTFHAPHEWEPGARNLESTGKHRMAIDDNRCRAVDCNALAQSAPASSRAVPGRGHAAGR